MRKGIGKPIYQNKLQIITSKNMRVKRLKSVEILSGDKVLVKNAEERGETGKCAQVHECVHVYVCVHV